MKDKTIKLSKSRKETDGRYGISFTTTEPTGLCEECASKKNMIPEGINTSWSGICMECKKYKQLYNEKRDFTYKEKDDPTKA